MWTIIVTLSSLVFASISNIFFPMEFLEEARVSPHSVGAVVGFGYCATLSFVINERNFENYKAYDKFAAVTVTLLLVSIYSYSLLMTTIFASVQFAFLLYLMAKLNVLDKDSYIDCTSIAIGVLAWGYFLYSAHFDSFYIFQTKFSYSLLALSFPFSLAAFSRIFKLLTFRHKELLIIVAVLVLGVLTMFLGMLLDGTKLISIFCGFILIIWNSYLVYEAYKRRMPALTVLFFGLLTTAILGIFYYIMSTNESTVNILTWHSHAAYMLWAVTGYYFIHAKRMKVDKVSLLLFVLPMVLSFSALGLYIFNGDTIFLLIATVGYLISIARLVYMLIINKFVGVS